MARRPDRRRALSALAALRTAFADRNYLRLREALARVLHAHVAECAARVKASGKLSISAADKKRWATQLSDAQRKLIFAMVSHGWELAGAEVGTVSRASRPLAGKASGETLAQKLSAVRGQAGDWNNFVVQADWPSVERWIKTTAESASATTGQRMLSLFDRASKQWEAAGDDGGKRGMTPAEIAKELLAEGIAQNEARARMLAHTGAIWAYGEGAVQRYKNEGVAVVEWLTADDDLRCPFCAEMNGKRVETSEPFFSSGDTLSLPDVGTLKIPSGARGFDVRHPPLHPNCRCTIIPIVDESQVD